LANEDRSYTCNCSTTMYSGENCENGIISTPNYPQFNISTQYTFSVKAKPDEDLVLTFYPDDSSSIIINPPNLDFTNVVHENNFTVSFKKGGLFKLRYKLSGASSPKFVSPQPSDIIVQDYQTAEYEYFASNGLQEGVLQAGCCFPRNPSIVYKCQSYLNNVKFTATCPWDYKGSYSTGIVFSSNNGFVFPVAISGVKLNANFMLQSLTTHELETDICENCEQDVSNVHEAIGQCDTYKPSKHTANIISFLNSETLAHTFFYYAHQLTPQWLRFNVTSSDRVHDANSYRVTLVESSDIETLKSCNILKTYSKGLYSVLVYSGLLNITVNSEDAFYQPNSHPVCFAINLCEGRSSPVYISIPDDSTNLIQNLRIMDIFKQNNWHISLKSVVITTDIITALQLLGIYWNGVDNFNVNIQYINLVLNGEIAYSFTNADFSIDYKFAGAIYLYTNQMDMVWYHYVCTILTVIIAENILKFYNYLDFMCSGLIAM